MSQRPAQSQPRAGHTSKNTATQNNMKNPTTNVYDIENLIQALNDAEKENPK